MRWKTTSEQAVASKLLDYGLTEAESSVYIYAAKRGASPAGSIARALSIRRGQTYNILRSLQNKGIIEAVAGRPTKFSAVPLAEALGILLEAHRQRERLMERVKPELLSIWQSSLQVSAEETEEEKFQFLKGVEGIYRKGIEMIGASRRNVVVIVSEPSLYHLNRLGVLEKLNQAAKRNVEVRALVEVTARVRQALSQIGKINAKSFTDHPAPHFLIVDENEIVFLTRPMESVDPREVTAVWTNSPMLIKTVHRVFENMWSSGKWLSDALTKVVSEKERETPEAKISPVKSIQVEFAKYLSASGFDVRQDHMIVGASGVEHLFSLAFFQDGGKPSVIDIESSDQPVTSVQIIRFFAKKLDVRGRIADATLVVKPNLDADARKLASFYQIRFTELG